MPKNTITTQLASNLPNATIAKQSAPMGDKNFDTMPSYLYYIKSIQSGNTEGAQKALNHVMNIRGVDTAKELVNLGMQLKQSNINSLAKRNVSQTPNEQMRLLYRVVNENPNVINNFNYELPTQAPSIPPILAMNKPKM